MPCDHADRRHAMSARLDRDDRARPPRLAPDAEPDDAHIVASERLGRGARAGADRAADLRHLDSPDEFDPRGFDPDRPTLHADPHLTMARKTADPNKSLAGIGAKRRASQRRPAAGLGVGGNRGCDDDRPDHESDALHGVLPVAAGRHRARHDMRGSSRRRGSGLAPAFDPREIRGGYPDWVSGVISIPGRTGPHL